MKTIILYGELAKRFGKRHRFAVKNAAEAVRALKANLAGFESFLAGAHRDGLGFRVLVGSRSLGEDKELHQPSGEAETIRFVPVMMGSKSGFFKIFLGIMLIAASIIYPPLAQVALPMGAGLLLGGVAQLLSKPPEAPKQQDVQRNDSYIFSGPTNTVAQGAAIPVGYGRCIVGSVVISAGIETFDE